MNATKFISFLCLLALPFGLIGQELPSGKAQKDQIASKLWRALGSDLKNALKCNTPSVVDRLVIEFKIPKKLVRKFLLYALNYSSTNLDIQQVLYRYPHYNEDAIKDDLMRLTEVGLMNKQTTRWTISSKGKILANKYWEIRLADAYECGKASEDHLKTLTSITEKLISAYAKNKVFNSVRLRIANRPEFFKDSPLLLMANEYQKDLTAIFNDNGHYRIDYLLVTDKSKKWQDVSLSALAKELLGATRNGRVYAVTKCADQPNWRVGLTGCTAAISELLNHDLIIHKNDSINQTPRGNELFQEAEVLADKRLYKAWDILSIEEYEALRNAIEWVIKS